MEELAVLSKLLQIILAKLQNKNTKSSQKMGEIKSSAIIIGDFFVTEAKINGSHDSAGIKPVIALIEDKRFSRT